MSIFADMEHIKFDYEHDNVKFVTSFDELAHLDTASIDRYMILACDQGQMSVDVNGVHYHLNTFEALILPPCTRLSNHMSSPGVRCDLAIITVETIKRLLGPHVEEWESCLYIHKAYHISTTEEDREQFAGYVNTLHFKLQQQHRRYNKEVIESLLCCILFDYLELMMSAVPQIDVEPSSEGQSKVLFRRFLELLTNRVVKHQLVDTYAQDLCVSPNYLTKVCKETTGKTALQWIREYTEADIRYYLLNSDMSIKEICDYLGFPNLSFFGKYCRRAFGVSPSLFRKREKEAFQKAMSEENQ